MRVLVSCVQSFIVGRFGLPHSPDDFEPSMAEAPDCLSVALPSFTELLVINLGPLAPPPAQICPQMDSASKGLIALPAQIDFVHLA